MHCRCWVLIREIVMKEGDAMRAHDDFSKGIRGRYLQRFLAGTNTVIIEPDGADEVRTSSAALPGSSDERQGFRVVVIAMFRDLLASRGRIRWHDAVVWC